MGQKIEIQLKNADGTVTDSVGLEITGGNVFARHVREDKKEPQVVWEHDKRDELLGHVFYNSYRVILRWKALHPAPCQIPILQRFENAGMPDAGWKDMNIIKTEGLLLLNALTEVALKLEDAPRDC